MKRSIQSLFYIMFLFLLSASCSELKTAEHKSDYEGKRLKVCASIIPFSDFAERIGGDLVEVSTIIPPGANPHVFEPSPDKLIRFSEADVFICAGAGFEFWKDKFVDSSANDSLTIVELTDGISLLDGEDKKHKSVSGDVEHSSGNPHVWLSPAIASELVQKIERAFSSKDPKNAGVYRKNTEKFLEELDELDKICRREISSFKTKKFLSQHSVWPYFAREYGLEEVGNIEKFPGKEPSPADIKDLIETAKSKDVKVIFTDAQFSRKAAEAIAEDGSLKIVVLDAIGSQEDTSYIDMMKRNLNAMSEVMKY